MIESDLLRILNEKADSYLEPSTRLPQEPNAHAPDVELRLEPGQVCTSASDYLIRGRIAEGGMGVVYKAYDQKLKREVAFKVLRRANDDLLERFLREQEMTAALDHPNFVRILSSGYVTLGDRSVPFYTMPLIRGRTLEQLILRRRVRDQDGAALRREHPLPSLLRMIGQLCLTLQSAHDQRIIHRDLKPSNVLVGPYGEVYVTDLGLAKFLLPKPGETGFFQAHVVEQLAKAANISQDAMMGTPYYMAPEQSLAPHQVDERADVFGLGALLYFVLTGEHPRFREPAIDRATLEARAAALVEELKPVAPDDAALAALLIGPRPDLSRSVRLRAEELADVRGILAGTYFHRFRFTMRECDIVPPGRVLEEHPDAAGAGALDPALEELCMKALAKDPKDRYASARLFEEAIHRYLEHKGEISTVLQATGSRGVRMTGVLE